MKLATSRSCLGRSAVVAAHTAHGRLWRPRASIALSFSRRNFSSSPPPPPPNRDLRMAVIGSGPAGFYTAYRVMAKVASARVDMYESLPVPFGLVRFGVAPDHPEVKNCQEKFEEVAASSSFRFLGNVAVGSSSSETNHPKTSGHVPLDVLARHYDAVVFAYGASRDRLLGIPGEDHLRGIYAARDFVGWYNGYPSIESSLFGSSLRSSESESSLRSSDQRPNFAEALQNADTAVVIGQGNVALDVARMLLEQPDVLQRTDISDAAVEALRHSRVRRVHIVGRRGPAQAAFTVKELRELVKLPKVGLHPVDAALLPPNIKALPRAQRRLLELVAKGSPTSVADAAKSWSLDFCLAPVAFGSENSENNEQIDRVTFEKTRLEENDPFSRTAKVVSTGEKLDISTQLVFRSIGYKSEPLAGFSDLGIPFDDRRGLIPNDGLGRVLKGDSSSSSSTTTTTTTTQHQPGFYCAGWVKRGPTGVIASTMEDAFTTADAIVQDWQGGAAFLQTHENSSSPHGWEGVQAEVDTTGAKVVSWADWQKIDQAEVARGKESEKPRSKFTKTEEMLAVLG